MSYRRNSSSVNGETILKVLFFVGFVGLIIWLAGIARNHQHSVMKTWAAENNCDIRKIERPIFERSPFWVVDDEDTVYKVTVIDGHGQERASWFWFSGFRHEQKWGD